MMEWVMRFLASLWSSLASESGMATLNVATKTTWDAVVPEYWERAIMYEADRQAILSRLAGPDGSNAAVLEKEDLTRQKGDRITFSTLQRLLGKGVSGTTALEGSEETIAVGTYNVTVQLFRHATAADEIATTEALFDFPTAARRQLADWLQRFLDDDGIDQVLNVDTIRTIYAGGKTSRGNLGPADLLLTTELRRLHLDGERRGVKPFQTTRKGQFSFPVFGALLSEIDYYQLASSDDFRQDVRLAAERGRNNPALDGNVDMYNSVVLYRISSVNPGDGMPGSFLRPEARLATALTASGTTVAAGPTTAVTNVDYWQYFPTSGTNTILIDAEQMTYSSAAGDRNLTVTRAQNGTTGVAHSAGAPITLNNVGKVLLFGRNFMLRAWAKRPERIRQERDYGMELGLGIKWIYENKGVANADGTLANAIVMEVYSPNPITV